MNFTLKDFKVGQKWKTRNGKVATITDVLTNDIYPVRGMIDTVFLTWGPNGRKNPDRLEGNDLIELVVTQTKEVKQMNKHSNHDFIVAFAGGNEVQCRPKSEYSYFTGTTLNWESVSYLRDFDDTTMEFRVKPKTKIINGFEVPMPMDKEPILGSEYFAPAFGDITFFENNEFTSERDEWLFDLGLCFHNKEDAIATAMAMLGIDPNS